MTRASTIHLPLGRHTPRVSAAAAVGGAFTLVELLVVVAVIAVLIGILLVAFRGARASAENASAQRLITTVGQGIESFERDLGYLPPLLVYDRAMGAEILLGNEPVDPPQGRGDSVVVPEAKWPRPDQGAQLREELEATRYGSEFTLAAYLLGTGDIDNSETTDDTAGRNDDNDDGKAGPGFRDPGPDRSWGGGASREAQVTNKTATKVGRVYGPYLDAAGLVEHLQLNYRTGMFKLLDSWGQPIRFYKRWAVTDRPDPGQKPRESVEYTPVELRTPEALQAQIDDPQGRASLEFERPVFTSRFMVMSAGRPTFFEASGQPIPLFGDRKRDGSDFAKLSELPSIQPDMASPFTPLGPGMNSTVRRNLIEDLSSNVRYVP